MSTLVAEEKKKNDNIGSRFYHSSHKPPRFNNPDQNEFAKTLNKRVADYFKGQKHGKYANTEMVVKTAFMFALFFGPYLTYMLGGVTSVAVFFALVVIQGFGKAGIGLSVMHDANHGAYSRNKNVNRILGYTLNMMGGNAINWKIQHNVYHHTYTNIAGHDEDISPRAILRFNPHSDLKSYHKFQYIYAWFLYGLMTITWITFKDVTQLIGYTKSGMLAKQADVTKSWVWLIASKVFYFGYALVLPMIVLPFAWWVVLLGFLTTHYVAGFLLGIIFQPAHVMEENEYPLPAEGGTVESNWSVHQLETTCNFANKNKLLSWYVGGLNYQVEHHLFPNVCHVHYRKISKIVESTAKEFNVPYKSIPSFRQALRSHGRMLYKLGRA